MIRRSGIWCDRWAHPPRALAPPGTVGLGASEIIGNTVTAMIVCGVWFALVLLLVPG